MRQQFVEITGDCDRVDRQGRLDRQDTVPGHWYYRMQRQVEGQDNEIGNKDLPEAT